MKNKFIILGVILAVIMFFSLSMAVNAEELSQDEVGTVIIESDIKGGANSIYSKVEDFMKKYTYLAL